MVFFVPVEAARVRIAHHSVSCMRERASRHLGREMSVKELQSFMARLYVDDSFLRLFEIDAGLVLDKYLLTDEERTAIEKLDRGEVRFFATSLKAKRKKLFKRNYASLFAVDPKTIHEYYLRFYDLNRIAPEDDQAQLYQRFGRFMEDSLHEHPHLPAYTSDLAKYSRLNLWAKAGANHPRPAHDAGNLSGLSSPVLARDSRPRLSAVVYIGIFDCRIHDIERLIRLGEIPKEVEAQPCYLVFRRADTERKMKVFEITEDTRRLVDACDGWLTADQIINSYNGRTDEDLSGSILETLKRLVALEVIEI